MQHYTNTLYDTMGNAIVGATVNVYAAGTTTASTIYSDNVGTSKSNPTTTGSDGSFDFYAANGRYDLVITHTGHTFTDADTAGIVLFDPLSIYQAWTPSVGGTATYSSREGHLVKSGRHVTAIGKMSITSIGTGNTSIVTGLPHAHMATTNVGASGSVGFCSSLASNVTSIQVLMSSGQSYLTFYSFTVAANGNSQNALFGNGTSIEFTVSYITED